MDIAQKLTVMLVDDSPVLLETAGRFLRGHDVEVVPIDSPFGVCALVQRHAPNVVVFDVMMPGLDGMALAQLLRKQEKGRVTPIVLYSAMPEEQLYAYSKQLPGVTYVPKTHGLPALLVAIRQAAAGSV